MLNHVALDMRHWPTADLIRAAQIGGVFRPNDRAVLARRELARRGESVAY